MCRDLFLLLTVGVLLGAMACGGEPNGAEHGTPVARNSGPVEPSETVSLGTESVIDCGYPPPMSEDGKLVLALLDEVMPQVRESFELLDDCGTASNGQWKLGQAPFPSYTIVFPLADGYAANADALESINGLLPLIASRYRDEVGPLGPGADFSPQRVWNEIRFVYKGLDVNNFRLTVASAGDRDIQSAGPALLVTFNLIAEFVSASPQATTTSGATATTGPAMPTVSSTASTGGATLVGRQIAPQHLIDVEGMLFFVGRDNRDRETGLGLWKSDGTESGTVLVKDIRPDATSSGIRAESLVSVGGTLFFVADDEVSGEELWKSDGTESGTILVRDIREGCCGGGRPEDLTKVNGTLFFSMSDGEIGRELWKSDGTEAGTVLVKDISPGLTQSAPRELEESNGLLFFNATDDVNARGPELWKSDGTEAGTVLVKDIAPGRSGSNPTELTDVNGIVFFIADNGEAGRELWKSEGTESGTALVKDIRPGAAGSNILDLTNVDGTLFFTAIDGEHGRELWKSDGTEAGTLLVRNIRPDEENRPRNGLGDSPLLTNVGGTVFFRANDGESGDELWKSDGTEAGTVLVKDIRPGEGTSDLDYLTDVDGQLFFSALGELWRSDGTEAGTVQVADINPDGRSGPSHLVEMTGVLYFGAYDDVNTGLWKFEP